MLAEEYVRHVGEGVAVVAAETRQALARAPAAISVEYEPLPALLGLRPPEKPPPGVREVVRVPVDDEGRQIGANPA